MSFREFLQEEQFDFKKWKSSGKKKDDIKSSKLMPTDDEGIIPPNERIRDANGKIVRKKKK